MGAFKGEFLNLLPQEKEVCFKIRKSERVRDEGRFIFDTDKLYLSESFVKKGWRMFLNKARGEVYILTGSAKIKVYHVCGNIKIRGIDQKEIGSFYIRVPYLCTSKLFSPAPKLCVRASFKKSKVYRSEKESDEYLVGTVTISKADA